MSLVAVEDRGPVRHIVMERSEKRNALNRELVEGLGEAFEETAADESVRVVVLRGAGPMFSAGMDLGDLSELAGNADNLEAYREPLLEVYNQLEDMMKPTIAQIHGAAIGGAMELALAADLRTMADDAVAGLFEARIGLIPDLGGCSRLPSVVGLGVAKELIMTGKAIDGREAHRVGFANRIAPPDELDAVTDQLANELLACAPMAVGLSKRIMDTAAKPAFGSTLEQEGKAQEFLAHTEDFAEGTRAFREKRDPEFAGR
jgi:enoyl-CoA hydratase/carnithine racemase